MEKEEIRKETFCSRLYRFFLRKEPRSWCYNSLWSLFWKPFRKYFSAVVIPTIPWNGLRILCYRMCGYKIGKGTFIGMRCYLDDMCYDKIVIGKNVIISYGCYFACHGRGQGHNHLVIEDKAYIGMRCSIIARHDNMIIGHHSVVGANSLVNKDIPAYGVAYGNPVKVQKIQIPINKK